MATEHNTNFVRGGYVNEFHKPSGTDTNSTKIYKKDTPISTNEQHSKLNCIPYHKLRQLAAEHGLAEFEGKMSKQQFIDLLLSKSNITEDIINDNVEQSVRAKVLKAVTDNKLVTVKNLYKQHQSLLTDYSEDLLLALCNYPMTRFISAHKCITETDYSRIYKLIECAILSDQYGVYKSVLNVKVDLIISTERKYTSIGEIVFSNRDMFLWSMVKQCSNGKIVQHFIDNKSVNVTVNDFFESSKEAKKVICQIPSIYTDITVIKDVTDDLGYIPEGVFRAVSLYGDEYRNLKRICSICKYKTSNGHTYFKINVCEDCKL